MPPVDLRIDAIIVSLGQSDAFRLAEELELRSNELASRLRATAGGRLRTNAAVEISRDERRPLAEVVEWVIRRGHQGEPLDGAMTLHRLRCLLIEAGSYSPPWDEEPDHESPSSP